MHKISDLYGRSRLDESGFTTAELLGNAALGILALAAIWGALSLIGEDLIDMMREKIFKETP